jgi:hypothetical protein
MTDLIQRILAAEEKGDQRVAIDLVYKEIDEMCLTGDLGSSCQTMADVASEDGLSISVLLSALTVTLPWRKKMVVSRGLVIEAVKRREPTRHTELLHGLDT